MNGGEASSNASSSEDTNKYQKFENLSTVSEAVKTALAGYKPGVIGGHGKEKQAVLEFLAVLDAASSLEVEINGNSRQISTLTLCELYTKGENSAYSVNGAAQAVLAAQLKAISLPEIRVSDGKWSQVETQNALLYLACQRVVEETQKMWATTHSKGYITALFQILPAAVATMAGKDKIDNTEYCEKQLKAFQAYARDHKKGDEPPEMLDIETMLMTGAEIEAAAASATVADTKTTTVVVNESTADDATASTFTIANNEAFADMDALLTAFDTAVKGYDTGFFSTNTHKTRVKELRSYLTSLKDFAAKEAVIGLPFSGYSAERLLELGSEVGSDGLYPIQFKQDQLGDHTAPAVTVNVTQETWDALKARPALLVLACLRIQSEFETLWTNTHSASLLPMLAQLIPAAHATALGRPVVSVEVFEESVQAFAKFAEAKTEKRPELRLSGFFKTADVYRQEIAAEAAKQAADAAAEQAAADAAAEQAAADAAAEQAAADAAAEQAAAEEAAKQAAADAAAEQAAADAAAEQATAEAAKQAAAEAAKQAAEEAAKQAAADAAAEQAAADAAAEQATAEAAKQAAAEAAKQAAEEAAKQAAADAAAEQAAADAAAEQATAEAAKQAAAEAAKQAAEEAAQQAAATTATTATVLGNLATHTSPAPPAASGSQKPEVNPPFGDDADDAAATTRNDVLNAQPATPPAQRKAVDSDGEADSDTEVADGAVTPVQRSALLSSMSGTPV